MPRKRPPPTEPHATEQQARQRVEELLRIVLDGAERLWDIREYVREKVAAKDPVWGKRMLSDSQIYRYLERVDALIEQSCKEKRKRLFRIHLAKRRNLYAKAVAQGDVRAALAVARDEAEMLKLYPAKRIEASGPKGGPIPTANVELTEDERARAVAALLARLGQANA